jgi:kynurenine formamidase
VASESEASADEFRALFDQVCAWSRWPDRAEYGALNHLTPERVLAAAELVREGRSVSLGRPLDAQGRPDNPSPADHHMTAIPAEGAGAVRFAKDYLGVDFHNDSHIDALSHVAYRGCLYGGASADQITADGAQAGSITLLRDGLIGRGVLLDIPALHGLDRLPDGISVRAGELEAALARQDLRAAPGDILLIRTGARHTGLDARAMPLLSDWQISALGSDGNNEATPSRVEGIDFPIHVLAVNAMGLHLLDYLQLELAAADCLGAHRWEFLLMVAPMRIDRGTGSPVNPIAVF